MLVWPSYSLTQAEKDFNNLSVDNMTDIQLPADFNNLRNQLIEARDIIFEKYNFDDGIQGNEKHLFDLELGLEMYEILRPHIENRDIYPDDIWRYLSVKVIPDIVHVRWGLNEDRFFRLSRRIYLKQIWWYIHLSWNTNKEKTFEILKNNTTDTILNLVERPGLGYHIEMYREIMRYYSTIEDSSRDILRRVMVLNTARLKTISPELVDGGITGYVDKLFKDVM